MVSDTTFVVNNIKVKASTETIKIYDIATRKGYVFDVPVLLQYFEKHNEKKMLPRTSVAHAEIIRSLCSSELERFRCSRK